ncbi:MAG TPA: hypothetical protein VHX61_14880 [Rhizomicrobium sp.]|nr:hypothetical protein [Rhizomicrobium sp.]
MAPTDKLHPAEIRLPADCPYRIATADRGRWREDLSDCCRSPGRISARDDEEPLCLTIGSEDAAYRFFWDSSFHGRAVVRIAWRGPVATLRWRYQHFRIPASDDSPEQAPLSPDNQTQFLNAIASFWSFGTIEKGIGLDGATWLIEGRRGDLYRGISQWSPRGELYGVGKLFFDLAGPPLSKIELY